MSSTVLSHKEERLSMDSGAKLLGFKSWPSTISRLILGKLLNLSATIFPLVKEEK